MAIVDLGAAVPAVIEIAVVENKAAIDVLANPLAEIQIARKESATVEVNMAPRGPRGATLAPNIRRHEWTGTYSYCAQAPNGSAESAEVWTITRLTVDADGTVTSGTATDVAWTDRAIATYI